MNSGHYFLYEVLIALALLLIGESLWLFSYSESLSLAYDVKLTKTGQVLTAAAVGGFIDAAYRPNDPPNMVAIAIYAFIYAQAVQLW